MINEENILTELFNYAAKKYGSEMEEFYDKFFEEFPYDIEGLDERTHVKNFVDWLILEKTLPGTGKRVVEEYIEDNPELDGQIKQKMLDMKNIVASEFIVLSKNKTNLKIKDRKTSKLYNIKLLLNNPSIQANTLIRGRIFPFGEIYMFAGAMVIYNSPMILDPDIFMEVYNKKGIEDAENILLSPNSKLTAVINKYPFQWVDGMCNALSISTKGRKEEKVKYIAEHLNINLSSILAELPDKSKDALKLILKNGGYIRYGELKEFDDELPYWWNNEQPASSIGILRLYGLLTVGKMPYSGRMFKVALIPKDIKEELEKII